MTAHIAHKLYRLMWVLFFLSCGTFFCALVANAFGWNEVNRDIYRAIILGLPAVTIFFHAVLTRSLSRALAIFILAAGVGWLFEVHGLRYGVLFGGFYTYQMTVPTVVGVPITVILYWAVFFYCGYSVTNSFWLWLRWKFPTRISHHLTAIWPLVLSDVVLVVLFDVFMDPLMVKKGEWLWTNGGPYFGVPLGNYLGWALAVVTISFIIRMWDFVRPTLSTPFPPKLHLIPILGYAWIACSMAFLGISLQAYQATAIGFLLMISVVVVNLFLYHRFVRTKYC